MIKHKFTIINRKYPEWQNIRCAPWEFNSYNFKPRMIVVRDQQFGARVVASTCVRMYVTLRVICDTALQ